MSSSTLDTQSNLNEPMPTAEPESSAAANEASMPTPENATGAPVETSESAPAEVLTCPACLTSRHSIDVFCIDCGFVFPSAAERSSPTIPVVTETWGKLLAGRYQPGELIGQRGKILRFRGSDVGVADRPATPVTILREISAVPNSSVPDLSTNRQDLDLSLEMEDPISELLNPEAETAIEIELPQWPSLAWEKRIYGMLSHLCFPRLLDWFQEDGFFYVILEAPAGQPIWDAWEAPETSWVMRCEWLRGLAEALEQLHRADAVLESIRPEMIIISPTGQAILSDLSELFPIPFPVDAPLRGSYYSAPELLLNPNVVDGRADLYSFGAMIQALVLGRELTELDFTLHGLPRSYLDRNPDVHPLLGRLLSKTFVREFHQRFPTEETAHVDPSGFQELRRLLVSCGEVLDQVRLEIAGWTTTGVTRGGNEDAFAILQTTEAKLEGINDFAVLLLADGMGGMESGEVASAMAIESLRAGFLQQKPWARQQEPAPKSVKGAPTMPSIWRPEDNWLDDGKIPTVEPVEAPVVDGAENLQEQIVTALREANRKVFDAARRNSVYRGMGCTAEVAVIAGTQVVIGHVGDSRTYHMRKGKLKQISQDQTLVNRLVEMGQLTPEEAETHPRRSELQQAIGGRQDVVPETYQVALKPGDTLLLCSDGLTNQLRTFAIEAVLRENIGAEKAARRLVNLANHEGSTDNVTVIVVRAH